MEYLHVINIEKYQPGYTDRKHIWAKIYYESFINEEVQSLDEIDRYRFWSLIVFEVFLQKPVPLNDTNTKIMGWNQQKRRISLTLQMLHTLIEVRNKEAEKTVPQSRVEKSRVDKNTYVVFDSFRKKYPGTKRGLSEEFKTFKKQTDWREVLDKLLPALEQQIVRRDKDMQAGEFVPPWKNLKTWLNERCWTEEKDSSLGKKPKPVCACGCGKEGRLQVSHQWFATSECRIKVLGW